MIRNALTGLLAIFLLMTGMARAETGDPEALMKSLTEEVLSILRQDKAIQSGNRQRAVALIESKVSPHFDFARMTSLAVGPAWRQADEQQRAALTKAFHTLLVRTYATSLSAYRDQTISFKPSARSAANDEIVVHSLINKPGAQPISLDYSLSKTEGGWKVFDVTVAKVSLIINYRSSFTNEVNKGGLDGLLKSLQDKNRRLETNNPSDPETGAKGSSPG